YELAYVVDAVDGEVAPGDLQVSLILSDPAGNNSDPYNDLESNTLEVYTELPTAVLAGTPEICEDEAAELTVYLQGRGPWSFSLYDGSDTAKFNNIAEDNFDLTVAPEQTTTFSVPVIMDRNGVKNTGSGSIRVTVYEKTDVQITNLASGYSLEADPVRLQANVPGGIFSGPGVIMISGSPYFDPALADTVNSPHTIVYTYTNPNGCISEASRLVFVLGAEGDVYIPSNVVCANGDPFMVNASNIAGVNGSFRLLNAGSQPVDGLTDNGDNSAEVDPALLVPGAYTIEYAYFDEVTLYIRRVFTVESVTAPVITNLVDDTYCQNIEPFLLQSSVPNTVFEGPGVSLTFEGFVFTPRDVKPGTIAIIATASSEHGCTASSQRDVEILFAPETKFSISTSCIPEEGGTVSFENLTSGKLEVETWNWDFGDPESGENNQSDLVNPKHFYSRQDEVTISLTATTYGGCMDTYVMDTLIGNMPLADFTVLSDCFANGSGIKFINRSTSLSSPEDSLIWTFATSTGGVLGEIRVDASTDTVAFPFVTVDSYRVGLAAVNSMGCVDTATREITLRPTIRLTTEGYDEQFNESEAMWTIQSNDGVESWTWDVPDFDGFIQTSGDKGWFTQLPYGEVGYLERSWVQSPCFDFTGMKWPVIKLDIMKSFIPGLNGAVLQYMDVNEEGWKTLGADTPGLNWYNVSTIYNQPGESSTGWGLNVFNPDTDWVTAIHDLNGLVGNRNVTFRLAIATTGAQGIGNQGFAFDNVTITERSKRAVLEHFTNSSNASSRSADDLIDAYGKTYAKDLVDLQYHMDYPGSDPMHDNNPSPPTTREFFYGVPQVPYAILDGGVESSHRYDFSELKTTPSADQINLVSLEIPAFDIDLEVDWIEGSLEATTTVTCVTDQYENNIQLYMVVFESLVTAYTGINGDTEFRNVVLDMMPTAAGRLLGGNWYRNVKDIRTDTWTYAPYVEDVDDLGVAAFVQDRNTGQILQAAVNYKTPQVGIGDQPAGLGNLHVYPNPASHSIYVNLGSRTEHGGIIRLTDMSGRVVIAENMPAGYQIYQLDIQHLNHGMYVLEWIESGRIRGLNKVVKSR
ncbi:MAG TPA: T9SS type A sorting domain-containing protein, partial [Bacteroides sp.]|nr:T9SS type A sorting domain-containing protein [Bacteroides sp.]